MVGWLLSLTSLCFFSSFFVFVVVVVAVCAVATVANRVSVAPRSFMRLGKKGSSAATATCTGETQPGCIGGGQQYSFSGNTQYIMI